MELRILFDLFKSYGRKFDAYSSMEFYTDESGRMLNFENKELFDWKTTEEGIEKLELLLDKSGQ